MTSIFRKSITAAAALLGLALSAQSHANLIITANGTVEASSATNSTATFNSMSTPVGGFNVSATIDGVLFFGGSGNLFDASSLDVSSSGSGTLTLLLVETGLSNAGSPLTFNTAFSSPGFPGLTVTRSFFLDSTNTGAETTLLSTTTGANASFLSLPFSLSGPFAIVEQIDITANGVAGADLSADDHVRNNVSSVPEPMSIGLFGAALAAVGFLRRRRKH
jgi:hypothetical protein